MKILVAEDKPSIAKLVQVTLEREGITVLLTYGGQEAVLVAGKEKPDLILMDLLMGEGSGFDAIKDLKSNTVTKTIPVIAMTAQAHKGIEDEIREKGFDGYFPKPFRPADLTAFVMKYKK